MRCKMFLIIVLNWNEQHKKKNRLIQLNFIRFQLCELALKQE